MAAWNQAEQKQKKPADSASLFRVSHIASISPLELIAKKGARAMPSPRSPKTTSSYSLSARLGWPHSVMLPARAIGGIETPRWHEPAWLVEA
jgi:hypothetical protein